MRSVFIVGPDKKIKLVLVYPMTTGRNFDEVLRVIDSLQLTANHKVATPAQWKQGDDVVIAGSVSNDAAKEIFGSWDEPKPYIRIVPQPREPAFVSYSFLSHLECSRTQDRYDADEVQGTSKVGAPLLARYDLEQVRSQVTREEIAGAPARPVALPRGAAGPRSGARHHAR